MIKKIPVLLMLVILQNIVVGQSKMAQLRKDKQNAQLNAEIFNDNDADFLVTETPDKWKNESAIILCQKFYYSYLEKGSRGFEYKETSRRRIKILDDAALEYYSVYYYKHSTVEGNGIGIKVIKPDGTSNTVDYSIAVDLSYNEIPENYRTFYYTYSRFKKIAIPNLEKGDIIDYYQTFSNVSKPADDYAFTRFTFTLENKYPTLKQKFFFNVDKKFSISFRSYNGAPTLKEGDAGTNRSGKVKEDIRTFEFEDSNREKYKDEFWKNKYLEDATIKFQVFYIPRLQLPKVKHFVNEKGLVNEELELEEIRKRLCLDEREMVSYLVKFEQETIAYINRYHKSKSKAEKVEIAYYYLRYKVFSTSYNIATDQEYFVDNMRFANTYVKILKRLKIDYQYVAAVNQNFGSFKNVLFPQELVIGVKVEGKYVFAPSQFTPFGYIPPEVRGSEAILYKFLPTRYKTDPIISETIPKSNYKDNRTETEQNVSIDDEMSIITVKETTTRKGYNKNRFMPFLLKDNSYKVKDKIRYDPRYKAPVIKTARGNKVKIAEQERVKKAKKKEAEKKRKEELKNYHDEDNYELEEYLDFELLSDGRFPDSINLVVKESYSLKNFINKAGRNYTFNIGYIIGSQFQLEKEDMLRSSDINLNYAKSYGYTSKIKIPDGYKVHGLDQVNFDINNNVGSFVSTAKVESGYIILNTEKIYKVQHANKEDWSKYIDFLEAAYNFTQKKVIFKK
jgi:Domain of Unknown Function with PDB structure (DUF3857)